MNLRVQDFDMNLEAGDYSDRFEVSFSSKTLNITETYFNDFNIIQNNNISELKIINPNALDITSLHVFDASGKQVLNENISEVKNTYTFSTKSLSDGVYIARIRLKNNQGFTKKVIVTNKK
ncbi:T9SS type A sorting domain-containing protein [Gelatiniphilus marinus]|uniref:T9SS type A sorting domain-containing protein n=1 Tax=Gelatiniphilus marinus TaxID=1759464 RepID=A0ABW5JU66_9FLAO